MKYCLGVDTSNYTTSLALVDEKGHVLRDCRRLLSVKKGEKGLRQQTALFQHIANLPEVMKELMESENGPRSIVAATDIGAVAVSTRPRPVEGSYMPVFNGGISLASSLAAALGVPLYEFSHQEGHLEAAFPKSARPEQASQAFHAFHMSGGTCELLEVKERTIEGQFDGYDIAIIGCTKDISFGQLLDRTGVLLGFPFPCGAALDQLALRYKEDGAKRAGQSTKETKMLGKIKVRDRDIHLSGTETQIKLALEAMSKDLRLGLLTRESIDDRPLLADRQRALVVELMDKIAQAIDEMTRDLPYTVLMGGVSESRFLRQALAHRQDLYFDFHGLGTDNAVGIARLGARKHFVQGGSKEPSKYVVPGSGILVC